MLNEEQIYYSYMTISFSYAYLSGFDLRIVSSPCVHIRVHRPSLAISPLMTISRINRGHRADLVLTVHQYCLCNVICIVASDNMVDIQACCTPV